MKKLVFIILLFFCSRIFACDCITFTLSEYYQRADFIAIGKIVQVDSSEHNNTYRDVEIEIIHLYKGKKITKLKLENHQKTLCSIYTPLNSTWLFYADTLPDGSLYLNACTRQSRIDQSPYYTTDSLLKEKIQASLKRELKVLDFLQQTNSSFPKHNGLFLSFNSGTRKKLIGFEEPAYNFSAFELVFNAEMKLDEIIILKSFENPQLADQLKEQLKGVRLNSHSKITAEKKERRFLVLFFFYPPEKEYPGFVGQYFF